MHTTQQHINPTQAQQSPQHESQSVKAYPSRTIVHAKLEMTEPGDHDEQEADSMADIVVSGGKIARKISNGGSSSGIAVSQQMESQLSQLQGGGRSMPQGLLSMMENGFGQDFGQVRIHTDAEAADMSSSISARAFTLGNDIYFNRGQFSPETAEGQRLVAHELTHVVQGTGKVGRIFLDSQFDRYNEGVREFVANLNSSISPEIALDMLNLVNDIISFINNSVALREMKQLKNILATFGAIATDELGTMGSARDIVRATTEQSNLKTGKASRRIGWAGVLLALLDFYSTIKSLDFDYNPKASTSVVVLKTINLASTVISQPSILAKVAATSPTTAALFFAFGTGYAFGDGISTIVKLLKGEAPGAMLVDYVIKKDFNKVTKDDVLNYFLFAQSRVSHELAMEYNNLDDHRKEFVTILNASKSAGNYKFDAFMRDYQKSLKAKNDGRFLKNCFVYSSTTSFPAGNSRINNLDIFILKKAFQRVGLY